MNTKRNDRNTKWYAAILAWSLLLAVAHGQITSVSPYSATQGTTGLTVTLTLDADADPPLPSTEATVETVMIGTLTGTSVNRISETVVTAVFDIPASEGTGLKDISITFSGAPTESPDPTNSGPPQGGQALTYTLIEGFTVSAPPNTAPTILTQPQSKAVRLDNAVTLTVGVYGSEPMTYQWQKDDIIIEDTNSFSYTIAAFTDADAGEYRCFVRNEFGADLSESATLAVDDSIIAGSYPIVDTGQVTCYDDGYEIAAPLEGEAFDGQDAQIFGNQPSYTDNGDGTVTDNVTGLMWQQSPDTDGDGDIDAADKLSYDEAVVMASLQTTGGYTDWRLPTIKELYSLMNFNGTDPRSDDTSGLTPFVDTDYFDFAYGDTAAGERMIDSQYASSTLYVSNTDGDGGGTLFGLNLADGRIKGYGLTMMGRDKTFLVLYVRGNTSYGQNSFSDNHDLTVTDEATGLMWSQDDSGESMNWQGALAWVQTKNAENYLGYSDWRLPNVKELHSLVDYTRSPDTTDSAAMDPILNITQIANEANEVDYPWFWSGTTHAGSDGDGSWGAYVAFGRALGYNGSSWVDVHGAGCQRSDPKSGDFSGYFYADYGYYGESSPQGDGIRIYNYVRLVRDATVTYPIVDTNQGLCYNNSEHMDPPAEGEAFYGQDAQYTGTPPSYTDNGDGTITDNVTGLVWTQEISSYAMSWSDAFGYCESLETGGTIDWRLPTLKELWSIRDFSQGHPWVDTDYFYLVGDGSELSQHHSWTCDPYLVESEYQDEQVEGDPAWIVNDWTGHIKAMSGMRFVRAVRGRTDYGVNDFVDNGDGTITDRATGLMWSQDDSGELLYWQGAIAYAEDANLAGYDDWRLPNIKELQSIADNSVVEIPAMDTDFFNLTEVTNIVYDSETGEQIATQVNYPFYWSSTSNPIEGEDGDVEGGTIYAWFYAAGYNVSISGYDLHGAGSICFGSKTQENSGIEDSVPVMVRLVRGGGVIETPDGDPNCINEDRVVVFPDGDTGGGGGGGDTTSEGGDGGPDMAAAATILGVTEAELIDAMGDPSQGEPDFAAAAVILGVTEQELMDALEGSM